MIWDTGREELDKTIRTRDLNDSFRKSGRGGRILTTRGVAGLGDEFVAEAFQEVSGFRDFNEGNDPHGEHDFGAVVVREHKLFWKIDYYDRDLEFGSPDPSNPAVTTRVLTVMLSEEY